MCDEHQIDVFFRFFSTFVDETVLAIMAKLLKHTKITI